MAGYVITLSSIPPRFDRLAKTLDTLLHQTVPAERIIVFLPKTYRRFPDWDGALPAVPKGVEIIQAEQDFGPATKLLPALQLFDKKQEILFCDDDMDYPNDWAAAFFKQRARKPDACITLCAGVVESPPLKHRKTALRPRAWRLWRSFDMEQNLRVMVEAFGRAFLGWPHRFVGRRRCLFAGYMDNFMGFGGVLVRPEFFDADVFDIPEEAWSVDDIWLSGIAMKNGHPVWMIPRRREVTSHAHFKEAALTDMEGGGQGRDAANARAVKYLQDRYGIWL
ncbi:glycosyltransferase family A protein [uncultured Shimia sp.]|uniref:glycosyltransferase family A protein n=1 Tax=uncultured Shimia sp. TaxID=573152 RepID=UPI002618BDCE|nr:glycosyltransferase family A protein [uncultured Shimia sp.]